MHVRMPAEKAKKKYVEYCRNICCLYKLFRFPGLTGLQEMGRESIPVSIRMILKKTRNLKNGNGYFCTAYLVMRSRLRRYAFFKLYNAGITY